MNKDDYTKPPYMSRWIQGQQVPCDMCRANRLRRTPPQEAIRETYTTLGIILNLCRAHWGVYRDHVRRPEPAPPSTFWGDWPGKDEQGQPIPLEELNLDDYGPPL